MEHPLHHKTFSRFVCVAPNGCWIWLGAHLKVGYGHFGIDKKHYLAHRFSYELANGPIPSGLSIDHLCRQVNCVNPAHLEAVPMRVNLLRGNGVSGTNARKTHCPKGHSLAEHASVSHRGHRKCKVCHAARMSAAYRNKREAAELRT